jgi:hypothetical protein
MFAKCTACARSGHSPKWPHAKKKDRLAAVSPKPNRMFGSMGDAVTQVSAVGKLSQSAVPAPVPLRPRTSDLQ